jgi:hypothetical protein
MPLSRREYEELAHWSFIDSYQEYEVDLVTLANEVFGLVCGDFTGQETLNLMIFEKELGIAMRWYNAYLDILKTKPHMPTALYASFAYKFGKYVLRENRDLVSQPCP